MFLRFTTTLSDGSVAVLGRGGAERDVTRANVVEFCRRAVRRRLRESHVQLAALRRGLFGVVPRQSLRPMTHELLRRRVCGREQIDVALLRRHTTYSGVESHAAAVQYFWRALESFSDALRRRFLRFAWAQERLPLDDAEFSRLGLRMLIKAYTGANDDGAFPRADTCFFNLTLPAYSSYDIARERILTAILLDADSMNGDAARRTDGGLSDDLASLMLQNDDDDDDDDNDRDDDGSERVNDAYGALSVSFH